MKFPSVINFQVSRFPFLIDFLIVDGVGLNMLLCRHFTASSVVHSDAIVLIFESSNKTTNIVQIIFVNIVNQTLAEISLIFIHVRSYVTN